MHPLISTEALASALAGAEPPVVLDVRWRLGGPSARQDYEVAHVPGAVYLDLDQDLADPPGEGGRHPLPDPERLRRVLRAAGVRRGGPVVAYDSGDGSVAARVWWLLRWAGHEEVAVLDGGFAAWTAEGRPVTAEPPRPVEGDVEVRPGGMPVLDAEGAAELARTGVLLDARAAQRYRGETEPVDPRAGHIPGAVNAPSAEHVGADGRWLGAEGLAARFAGLGVRPDRPVGAYCGSGVTASSVVLALEVAGVTAPERPAALYAGSWSHWCVDPDRPVATGPQPG
ncbi:sulfurtransferase [Saccharothrix coeruleofusca]|uniref:Sulfurtransferase n=1 Tax=Saccharothrix coeruleofusca TaxID=33919 RepID=A0A918AIE3_9PSEU|nr:sulfurtransferase [Saccharothrix coeruleofusca]MBP2334495.1 thiosulfate/3-mercaptopyruvate sulfurtransferase [Saccharothrix coeruleofusca]GGP40629.1 sulfurtransferase [Saccharothrix coeruleofusca]